ncbi:MAG: peptidoglycan DD-metalloendopeptidase family protein [Mycoplasmatales bacterium]
MKINLFNKIKYIIIIIVILFTIFTFDFNESNFYNNVVYVYDQNNFVSNVEDKNIPAVEEAYNDKVQSKNSNVNLLDTKTLLYFDQNNEDTLNTVSYIKENAEKLKSGYTVTIDDNASFFITDLEFIDWVKKQILSVYIPSKDILDYYLDSGNFNSFELEGKIITSVLIDNNIEIEEGYNLGSKIISNKEDLLFKVINGDQQKQLYKVKNGDTLESIASDHSISENNLLLNNTELNNDTLLYDGQEIIVNKEDTNLNITQTYERKEREVIKFGVSADYDSSLAAGKVKTINEGKNGLKYNNMSYTVVNDKITDSYKVSQEIITKPVEKKIIIGTKGYSGNPADLFNVSNENWAWPSNGRITCRYGNSCYWGHTGLDLSDYYGAPEFASRSGYVTYAGWGGLYGWEVVIDHGDGFTTRYAHQCKRPPVSAGEYVTQGQIIGYQGQTGNAYGDHLHFEIMYNGKFQDPLNYLP